jgi:hypothetical protein
MYIFLIALAIIIFIWFQVKKGNEALEESGKLLSAANEKWQEAAYFICPKCQTKTYLKNFPCINCNNKTVKFTKNWERNRVKCNTCQKTEYVKCPHCQCDIDHSLIKSDVTNDEIKDMLKK